MNNFFDGKAVRDEILLDLSKKIADSGKIPVMAEILIGDDPVSTKYVELKKKMAEKIGIQFCLYKFGAKASEDEIIECIKFLDQDAETLGMLIQIPLPEGFDRKRLVEAISPEKDIDGLRFCEGLDSDHKPPVVMAIMEAINQSKVESRKSKVVIIGRGFLVGAPLERTMKERGIDPIVILNEVKNSKDSNQRSFADAQDDIRNADILISATGKAGLIKPDMVKEGAVLIDAGTAEENGELLGDIDPEAYKKASYYTPVPGGIGPVTIAMLFKNLIK